MSENGRQFGPYRVWCANQNKPGLAMTRSIGDSLASEAGVINTPTIQSHELDDVEDQFLVIATDGIWDMMDVYEVTNYVQTYRSHCIKETETYSEEPWCHNSCIAQLLCEEARLRWLKVIEAEGVVVDDICCVVVEFNNAPTSGIKQMVRVKEPPKRDIRRNSLQSSELMDQGKFSMQDKFRASNIEEN